MIRRVCKSQQATPSLQVQVLITESATALFTEIQAPAHWHAELFILCKTV